MSRLGGGGIEQNIEKTHGHGQLLGRAGIRGLTVMEKIYNKD